MLSSEQHFDREMRSCDPDLEDGGADEAWINAAGALAASAGAGAIVSRQQSVGSAQPASSSGQHAHSSAPPGSSSGAGRSQQRAEKRVTKNQNRPVNKKLCTGLLSAGIPANALKNPDFLEALNAIAKIGPNSSVWTLVSATAGMFLISPVLHMKNLHILSGGKYIYALYCRGEGMWAELKI